MADACYRKRVPWIKQLWDIASRYDKYQHYEVEHWREVFNSSNYNKYFYPAEERTFPHDLPYTLQEIIDRALTWSAIAPLDNTEKEKVKDDVKAIIERGDGLEWVNREKGVIKFSHDTLLVIIRRK